MTIGVGFLDVDLTNLKTGGALDALYCVLAYRLRLLGNRFAVIDVYRQVHRGLPLTDIDGDVARPALPAGNVSRKPDAP